jgi:DNA (cytosine-5)-methyltransferase 1
MMFEQLSLMMFQPPTSGASASHAKTSASQASKKACKKVSEADCFTKLCDCLPAVGKKIDPDGYSLKMLKIYLALEMDLTSLDCSLKWGGYGYSLQWDTLNSKDYGVPQNRARVFIVCYLGNISGREIFPLRRTDGENSCELKEITQGVSDAQRIYESDGLARTLKGESGGQGGKTGLYAVKVLKPYGSTGGVCGLKITENETGIASPCVARDYKGISRNKGNAVVCMSIRGQKLQKQIDVAPTIDTGCRDNLTRKQTCCAVLTPDREKKRQNGRRIKEPGEPSFTLTAQDRHGVAIYQRPRGYNKGGMHDIAPALSISAWQENNLLANNIRIRRLTPRECWRLQGFPDEYFDKAKAAGISNTQLYKQAGNSVTVNVAKAIGERLKEVVDSHG